MVESLENLTVEPKAARSEQRPCGSRVETCGALLERSLAKETQTKTALIDAQKSFDDVAPKVVQLGVALAALLASSVNDDPMPPLPASLVLELLNMMTTQATEITQGQEIDEETLVRNLTTLLKTHSHHAFFNFLHKKGTSEQKRTLPR